MKGCILDIEVENKDPKYGRVICIGVKDIQTDNIIIFHDDNEKVMLEDFLDFFCKNKFQKIIGYNILFDIRFIFIRCLKYGIVSNGFFSSKIVDLMEYMKSVNKGNFWNKPGTLNEWAEFLFGTGKYPLSESIRKKYWKGKISEIIEYNKRDLELTYMLWKRIRKVLGNGSQM